MAEYCTVEKSPVSENTYYIYNYSTGKYTIIVTLPPHKPLKSTF